MNFEVCNDCSICVAGCAAFQATGDESLTAQARNHALKNNLSHEFLEKNIDSCSQTGFCTAVCPLEINNDQIVVSLKEKFNSEKNENEKDKIFNKNWNQAQNLYGESLEFLNVCQKTSGVALHLGCTFRRDFINDFPLVEKACRHLNVDIHWETSEKCCGRFFEDLGIEGMNPHEKNAEVIYLDSSCASRNVSTRYLWDELFLQPGFFEGLAGKKIWVSARWFNDAPRKRFPLVESFCQHTGAVAVNIDPLGGAQGTHLTTWRSRLGMDLLVQSQCLDDFIVMETAERHQKNSWILEFLK